MFFARRLLKKWDNDDDHFDVAMIMNDDGINLTLKVSHKPDLYKLIILFCIHIISSVSRIFCNEFFSYSMFFLALRVVAFLSCGLFTFNSFTIPHLKFYKQFFKKKFLYIQTFDFLKDKNDRARSWFEIVSLMCMYDS